MGPGVDCKKAVYCVFIYFSGRCYAPPPPPPPPRCQAHGCMGRGEKGGEGVVKGGAGSQQYSRLRHTA